MARFVFQLDAVLRQRKLAEEQKQRELAVVQAEMTELETQLRDLDQTVQSTTADVRSNHLTGRLDLNFLAAHRRFTAAMQRKAVALAGQMAAVKVRLEAARAALAEAAGERKILEKLREKREAEWKAAQVRKEMAALDEIGTRIGYENGPRHAADQERPADAAHAEQAS
jgi:flagellar protein FliJ